MRTPATGASDVMSSVRRGLSSSPAGAHVAPDQPPAWQAGGCEVLNDGAGVLRVVGELDIATAGRLAAHLEQDGVSVIDLADVTFIDSSGLLVLVRAVVSRQRSDGLVLRAPTEATMRLLAMAGLTDLLPIETPLRRATGIPASEDTESVLEIEPDDEGITVRGEIDMETADRLAQALEAVSGTAVVDLEAVTFLDSVGICCLLKVQRAARNRGDDVILRHPSLAVRRVLELANLLDSFTIIER
jgi:anti-sigma B factor antagonist